MSKKVPRSLHFGGFAIASCASEDTSPPRQALGRIWLWILHGDGLMMISSRLAISGLAFANWAFNKTQGAELVGSMDVIQYIADSREASLEGSGGPGILRCPSCSTSRRRRGFFDFKK